MSYRSADVRSGRGKRGAGHNQRERRALTIMALVVFNTVSATAAEPQSTEHKLICTGLNNQSYNCDSGHCCGESQCCSNYYEMWWFWLVWTVIIILSCCCVCHHRRTKHRLQQQQRQHEINLIAYREVHNHSSLPFYFRFLPSYLLPAYEEVVNRPPTPPPPYSASQPGQGADSVSPEQPGELCPLPQSNSTAPASESNATEHYSEETCHPPDHCPLGDAHKSYLDFEDNGQQPQVASATLQEITMQGKEPSKSVDPGLDTCPESKDKNSGRHRRFTGDSGIEVCVCSRGPGEGDEEDEMKELDGSLDSKQDFCDSCNPHSSGLQGLGDEEQGFAAQERSPEYREPPLQRLPICLHLHTINEQEAPQNGSNAEPQS